MRMFVTNISLTQELRDRTKATFPISSMSAVIRVALKQFLREEEERRAKLPPQEGGPRLVA